MGCSSITDVLYNSTKTQWNDIQGSGKTDFAGKKITYSDSTGGSVTATLNNSGDI